MVMSVQLSIFIIFVAHFVAGASGHSTLWEHFAPPTQLLSNRQCFYAHPLRSVGWQSAPDGMREHTDVEHPSVFHDHHVASETRDAPSIWSYPPICTGVLQSIKDRLCIYTSLTIGNGRGISVFTTPSLAASLASLPIFTGCPKEDQFCHDMQESLKASEEPNQRIWRTASLPGKGIGMLASRTLRFNDLVTAYTPAFVAYLEIELSTMDRESLWRQAIEQLPAPIRKRFLALTYIYGDERVRVQDIVKANTFQVAINGVNHLAVFPETSRLNHACNPNAQYVIDNDLLTHSVRVSRDIQEGEEVTIAYTSPLEPTPVRQQHLQQGFHFTCTCQRCTKTSSDAVLETIMALQNQLNDWSPASLASPEIAEHVLALHREEGLEGFMDIAYGFAALTWNAVGETEKAVMYAELARRAILMKDGKWAPNLQIWTELLKEPREHWSYRRRL